MLSNERPEAVVIVNPTAGRLSQSVRGDVIAELRRCFSVRARFTSGRGTATEIAAQAAADGVPLAIAFGGDGHVNEVANGVAGTSTALAVIPGGTMNVFARALGVPVDSVAAVRHVREAMEHPRRRVPLGKMDDRLFTFSAGCGFDAEAAERVERYVPSKRRFGELFFYWSAFRVVAGSVGYRRPYMRISGDFGEVEAASVIVTNAAPYAYLFGRPVNVTPGVQLEGGIDVFALRSIRIEALPVYVWKVAVTGHFGGHGDAFCAHDLDRVELAADRPFGRHVDGESVARASSATFSVVRDALAVVG
jgi:diacylglycerol kinase family enzyme